MFDPARDDDPGNRRFYVRIAAMFVIGLVAGLALLPSITGFDTQDGWSQTCVAAIDGWRADPGPAAMTGSHACVPESRHRLLITGSVLGVTAFLVGGGLALSRARHRRQDQGITSSPRGPSWQAPSLS